MEGIREVTVLSVVLRIAAAVLLGGFMGMERGIKRRAAGLRTYMLVCVGSCMIMLTNQYIFQNFQSGDPVRMGAQVVSGIGFLGAGTIIVTRHNQIKGLTTAAGLWASAGVGLALGIGFYEAALVGSLAVFLILTVLNVLDHRVQGSTKGLEVYVELGAELGLGDLMKMVRPLELEIVSTQIDYSQTVDSGARAFILTLKSKKRKNHAVVLDEIRQLPGVKYIEEL
ncbi:MAG: MgtC/SapB family protein [Faecousia sp.]